MNMIFIFFSVLSTDIHFSAQCDVMRDGESPPAARPRPRPRPASEQLLGSNRIMQGSRPVGIVVDVDVDRYKDKQDGLYLS